MNLALYREVQDYSATYPVTSLFADPGSNMAGLDEPIGESVL